MKIEFSPAFKKNYKKRISKNSVLKYRFEERLTLFQKNPFDPKLETHKLTSLLKDLFAFSVDFDCRVIFAFRQNDVVVLLDIGTHDQVY